MSLTLEDGDTLIDKSLKFCFRNGDRRIINSVLELFILIYFLIIHTLMSEIHMFNFVSVSKVSILN